ncbi:flagellar hook-length control protein FliK [Helicobacter mustelae]|uniref:flagellar hook-length control protein FliK n=1 Tax=Helicobacter mustelae TaxID=217 RepID=UPI0002E0F3E5|nr:flagellar hook-length control protein FliK [Helicobacter mustelae]SQH71550.1 flagellar hook-length control protein [Helicobacter mustelae]STP12675.1 flagellar hook-length control protein [Helicobacter mustelae]
MKKNEENPQRESKEGGDSQGIEEKKESAKPANALLNHQITKSESQAGALRATLSSFAQQIKEAIKNYKPPLTKLEIELNPKDLGKVELSISKKGKDLQISISSNIQAINLFAQNQVDLRQHLQNIGFQNIDLNFSHGGGDLGGGSSQDEGGKQKRNENGLQAYKEIEDSVQYDHLEIVLPKYA